jgi:hypothetical protein
MPRPFQKWTVLPHGRLTPIDDDILSVVGDIHMPIGDFPRRMTVIRLADRRLVIYSAIALDEQDMLAIESFGDPAFLVVPSGLHRMDAKIWKDRYPRLHVVAPAGARAKVEEVVHVDATFADFADPNVHLIEVPGTDAHEAALVVQTAGGANLIVNDLIANIPDRRGFGGWILRMVGFTGPKPRIPKIVEKKVIKDRSAVRVQLERWAGLSPLKRIIVSHGAPIEIEPAITLRHLANSLAG